MKEPEKIKLTCGTTFTVDKEGVTLVKDNIEIHLSFELLDEIYDVSEPFYVEQMLTEYRMSIAKSNGVN